MPYTFGLHDYARLRKYAEDQSDILRLSKINEVMLSNIFGMRKASECPIVRYKNINDEMLSRILGQDRDFDYGIQKPNPPYVSVDGLHFPRCMCQEFYDDKGRSLRTVSFYQVPDAQRMGEAMSDHLDMMLRMRPEMKKQLSEQLAAQMENMKPNLQSFMIFYGGWKRYDDFVLEPDSEQFNRFRELMNRVISCPRFADSAKNEMLLPSDISGFLLDQLF